MRYRFARSPEPYAAAAAAAASDPGSGTSRSAPACARRARASGARARASRTRRAPRAARARRRGRSACRSRSPGSPRDRARGRGGRGRGSGARRGSPSPGTRATYSPFGIRTPRISVSAGRCGTPPARASRSAGPPRRARGSRLGSAATAREHVGVLEQRVGDVADQVGRGLVARDHEQQDHELHHLAVGERHLAVLLGEIVLSRSSRGCARRSRANAWIAAISSMNGSPLRRAKRCSRSGPVTVAITASDQRLKSGSRSVGRRASRR